MRDIIHRACGKLAFRYDGPTGPDDVIVTSRATLPDGSKPEPGKPMKCGSCGLLISPAELIQEEGDAESCEEG